MRTKEQSLFDIMLARKDCYMRHDRRFKRIFGVGMWQFMDLLTGFDVVKFDDWLETPDGLSTADHLAKKYGKEARDLVKALIGA